jgi:MFS family permease
MWRAMHVRDFWLLAGAFCICGATSAGLVGSHLIAYSVDRGVSEVAAATALGVMGVTNFIGTVGSGWLTDRYNPRRLLAAYLIFRSGFLLFLPLVDSSATLAAFALVFGLNYIATSPPTVALIADMFGRRNVGTIYGWVFFAHHTGAAIATTLAGVTRDVSGSYSSAFLAGAGLALAAGLMVSQIGRTPASRLQPDTAGSPA